MLLLFLLELNYSKVISFSPIERYSKSPKKSFLKNNNLLSKNNHIFIKVMTSNILLQSSILHL